MISRTPKRRVLLWLIILSMLFTFGSFVSAQSPAPETAEDEGGVGYFDDFVNTYHITTVLIVTLGLILVAVFIPKLAWKSGMYTQWWWRILREAFLLLLYLLSLLFIFIILFEWSVLCVDAEFSLTPCVLVSLTLIGVIFLLISSIIRRKSVQRSIVDGLLLFFYGLGSAFLLVLILFF